MTIFGSMEIGRRSLRAQLKGMEVSGQNVANANTPGYSRQRVDLQAIAIPLVPGIPLSPGRGVKVAAVQRIQSQFYRSQLNQNHGHLGYWETCQETFQGVEVILMEPEEHGLNRLLGDFFDLWHELSASPESMDVRTSLQAQAVTFTRTVQEVYLRSNDLSLSLQEEMTQRVEEINFLTKEIAAINEKVTLMYNLGDTSNELLDQLDRAVEQLSALIDVQTLYRSNGVVQVFTGGRMLVQDNHSYSLSIARSDAGAIDIHSDRGQPLTLHSGRLAALQQSVNAIIPDLQGKFDQMVCRLVEEVNALHRDGYGLDGTGERNFFEPIVADSLIPPSLQFKLSADLFGVAGCEPARVAAAFEPGEPGNGANALEVARLREALIMEDGTASIIEYYRSIVASLGVEGQECERMVGAYTAAEAQLFERNQAIAGVDLDEEMLNMIQFQHAWHAASLFIKSVDEMLSILLYELGR